MIDLQLLCKNTKDASAKLIKVDDELINKTLIDCANALVKYQYYLVTENKKDIEYAEKNGKSEGFIDRLVLSEKVISGMADGLKQVATLNSPLDKVVYEYENTEQDIKIVKTTVPFGVIGIIYESRPNVTADAFALTLKTKNAVILKGGSDAINTNIAIVKILRQILKENGIPECAISLIEDTSRETTVQFMKMNKYVDLLIPRGSASLINSTIENTNIPIIETGTGNCHIFVDETADLDESAKVIFNAKTQRYSVCNACESLVIHSSVLETALTKIYDLLNTKCVEMRLDDRAYDVLKNRKNIVKATEEDFYTEYGGPIISVKTVDSVDEAIAHINEHSTRHSESIMTNNLENAQKFLKEIDSSSVYHNASTRFTDGFVFGLGAEIGISTQKLHARGPMGLDALITTKYVVYGNNSVRK